MLNSVSCNPLVTKLKIAILVVAIFVCTGNVQDACRPIKIIQLCANKCLNVLKGMIFTIPAINFIPLPGHIDLLLLL